MSSPYTPVQVAETRKVEPAVSAGMMAGGTGITMTISLGLILSLIFSYGAAKLSYDTFQSVGWAVVAFFFSGIYYPYYALFVHKAMPPAVPSMLGARRR